MQIVEFDRNQFFLDEQKQVWRLIDITEIKSLLDSGRRTQVIVHLFNHLSKKIKRISYVDFESNFTKIESGLIDEVNLLNRIFSQE